MRVIIDIRRTQLEQYPYKTTPLDGLYFPRIDEEQEETKFWDFFGVNDSYFGGNIHKIAKIKGKSMYIIVNTLDQTLGILYRFEELNGLNKNHLRDLCNMLAISFEDKETKEDLVDKLTALKT